jgi:hypothetical protein
MSDDLYPGCEVVCMKCRKGYVLTPLTDYYNATNATDGVCEACQLVLLGVTQIEVVNPEQGERLMNEYTKSKKPH